MNAVFVAGRDRALGPGFRPRFLARGLPALLLFAWTGLANAQLPHLDPLPFWTPADTSGHRALHLEAMRFGDGASGWTVDRILLDARLPVGERGGFVARLPWLRFDAGGQPATERWPSLAGAEATADWPGESVLTGIGQLELGATGPVGLPLLGESSGSLAVGVPLGHNRFYPWSSAGLPIRLGLGRWRDLGSRWWLSVHGVYVAHGGPGGEELAPTAFPDGWHVSLGVERADPKLVVRLGWERRARAGRVEQWLAGEASVPWSDGGRVGLRAACELTDSPDRAAAWLLGAVWRIEPRSAAVKPPHAKAAAGAKR